MEEILRNCKPGLKESKSARIEEVRKRPKVDYTDAWSEHLRAAFCGPLYPLHKRYRKSKDDHGDNPVEKKLEKPEDEHGHEDPVGKKVEKLKDEHGDEDRVEKEPNKDAVDRSD